MEIADMGETTVSVLGMTEVDTPVVLVPGLRSKDAACVLKLFDSGRRIVTVTGIGGIGKSTLAREVVEQFRQERPEFERAQLDLAEGDEGVRERVLDVLGDLSDLEFEADRDTDVVRRGSRDVAQPRLLVLDSGESVPGLADVLDAVLAEVPGLRLLVTSRVPVGAAGESVVPLRGLDARGASRLFSAFAEAQAISLPADAASRVREIVAKLDGHPLAIRLSVLQLREASFDEVYERTAGRGTTTLLREVVSWSLDRCPPPAVDLLRVLSVFAGWGSLDSIEGIAAALERPTRTRRGPVTGRTMWLAQLVDSGLVDVGPVESSGWNAGGLPHVIDESALFRVHDLVREAVRGDRVAAGPSVDAAVAAHHEWFRARAEDLGLQLGTRRESTAQQALLAELPEFLRALDSLIASDPLTVLRVAARLGDFWVTRGHIRSGAWLIVRSLRALGEDAEGLGEGSLDVTLGQSVLAHMRLRAGERIPASEYRRWLRSRLDALMDPAGPTAHEHFQLALHFVFAAMVASDYTGATELGIRFRDLAIAGGDDYHAGSFSFFLARVAEQEGDDTAASAHIERAIGFVRRTGNESFLARCVSESVLLRQAELSPAELVEALTPLVELHRRHRSLKDASLISVPLAIANFHAGRRRDALELLRVALASAHRIHFFDGELSCVVLIAFSELSEESSPENLERCARLYGGVRPYLSRFRAAIPPGYGAMLDGGIQGLEVMLGSGRMNRIVSLAPTAWSEVVADADAFVVEQLETLRPDAASVVPVVDQLAEGRRALVGRETELLELLLTGMSDKRIAAQLELRPNTVRSYNSRIFRKFGVASRSELLALYQSR